MSAAWTEGPGVAEIGAARLETLRLGPAPTAAPTIVLLHEGLGSTGLWRDFPAALAAATGCGVFAYSRAGYGGSSPAALPRPIDYMTREAVETLPAILDHAGVESAILLGHSDGATIAAIYAGSVQDHRVRGLVLMAPHFFTEPMGLAAIAEAKTAYETGDLRDRLAKHHQDVDNAFRGWNDAWLNPEFAAWHVAEVIDYVRIPVLAIQGRDDQYGTLAQIDEITSRSYAPVDTLILDDCRHAPQFDQPERVLAEVAEFTARLTRIDAADIRAA